MKFQVFIIAVLTASASCSAAERRILSTAPNRRVAIVETRSDDGDRDYYFVRSSDNKRLGFVLPSDQRNEISNVAIVASWRPHSTKVALLVFYGTKLSELFSSANATMVNLSLSLCRNLTQSHFITSVQGRPFHSPATATARTELVPG